MSAIDIAAAIPGTAARDAAWEALLEDREVTWLQPVGEVQP